MDNIESFLDAVLREVKEEVGLDFIPESSNQLNSIKCNEVKLGITAAITPLIFYESVYPISLKHGEPKSHHFIVFYSLTLNEEHSKIKLIIQPEEVDTYTWIDRYKIKESLISKKTITAEVHVLSNMTISYENTSIRDQHFFIEQEMLIDFSKQMSFGHRLALLESLKD